MNAQRRFLLGSFLALALAPVACALETDRDPTGSATAALAPTGTDPPDPTGTVKPPPPPPPSFESLMAKYSPFDINGDGLREIELLTYATTDNVPPATSPKGMAIVFVNPELLIASPNDTISVTLLRLWLALYRSDLMGEGYDPRFVLASVHRGDGRHQDGRDLMALRRFVKEVRSYYPVRQVLFFGDFPEATLLRRTLVRGSFRGAMKNGNVCLDCDVMAATSELIAGRTDLPLADLDGNWEALYQENVSVTDVVLAPMNTTTDWPAPGGAYTSTWYQTWQRSYQDVFYIRDDDTGFWDYGTQGRLTVSGTTDRNPELAASDQGLANPIARPEIQVSRINPKHMAVQPFTLSPNGYESALDVDGFPNSVPAYNLTDVLWRYDSNLERRLLVDFFQRAHAYRSGSDGAYPFRAGSLRGSAAMNIGWTPGALSSNLGAAATFTSSAVNQDNAMLDGYVSWLKQPAVLRGIVTHSGAVNSWVGGPVSSSVLESAVGSRAFTWVRKEGVIPMLIPTYDRYNQTTFIGTVDANMRLHRALWTSRALANAGQRFYVPFGCEVNSPAGFASEPYYSDRYAPEQNAESTLFFVNGLGVLSRSKVFNDYPPSAAFAAIKSSGNFGAALPAYFAQDAATAGLNPATRTSWPDHRERTLQRKRAYTWGVIGDGTLRLRY